MDQCQLFKSVQPIFALKIPAVNPPPPPGSVLEEVIRNFETMYEFEMLQLAGNLPELEVLALSGNVPVEVASALGSLLQVLESQVSAEAMDLCPVQKIVRLLFPDLLI